MWGAIIGGALGLMGANKQAKSQDAATAAQMAGFNQYKPYVDANLSGSSAALDGVLSTGAYTGQTLAGPNQFQTGTATNMGNIGGNLQTSGYDMMNANNNFGGNYQNMYGQSQGLFGQTQDLYGQSRDLYGKSQDVYNQGANLAGLNTDLYQQNRGIYDQFSQLSQDAKADRLSTAMDYASANANPLVDAAMRDDRRNLQENTLTGIDLAASGSGNMNSSRAGVAEAVANRAFDDRRADVALNVQDRLIDRSLNQQARQFADQSSALTGAGNAGASQRADLAGAGSALANQNNSIGTSSNTLTASGNQLANGADQLGVAGNMNSGIQGAYTQGLNTLGQGANFGMNAGNSLQGYDQAALTDAQLAFERQRDFEMQQRQGYQSGILGQAPVNVGNITANKVDPYQAALGGAMSGFGFQQQYFPQQTSTAFNPFSTATPQQQFNNSIAPPSFSF